MTSKVIYSSEKDLRNVIKFRHFIPYKVDRNSRYEANRTYYNAYWGQVFKVIDVKYDHNGFFDSANIQWDDGCYGLFCTELDLSDYILKKDRKEIYKIKDIINTDKSYTGAEIVYWFYLNGIDPIESKYSGFYEYVDYFNKRRIQDWNRYTLYGKELSNGKIANCRIFRVK